MNRKFLAPAALAAAFLGAALSGCAHGEPAASEQEVRVLREELRSLRADRDEHRRRIESLEALLASMSRKAAAPPSSAAQRAPRDLEVVKLEPKKPEPQQAPSLPPASDDSFIFIVDEGGAAARHAEGAPRLAMGGPTGGPDAAPPLPTDVDLAEPPAAGKDYEAGLAALSAGRFGEAAQKLEAFAAAAPRDTRADNAVLALGDAFRADRKPGKALQAYERVATEYPAGDAVADALLRYGETCMELGRSAAARAAFQRLVEDHPGTDQAARAGEKLAGR